MTPMPGLQPLNPLVAQYLSLQEAIGLGARTVRFQDRTIEYQSLDEMIKASNYLYLKLSAMGLLPGTGTGCGGAGGTGTSGVKRQIRMYTEKGL